jgi:hypothetical protein
MLLTLCAENGFFVGVAFRLLQLSQSLLATLTAKLSMRTVMPIQKLNSGEPVASLATIIQLP